MVTWRDGRNAMRDVEYGAYFKHASLVSVKIISFLNEITNLKKMLVAPAVFECRAEYLLKMIVVSEKCSRETYLLTYFLTYQLSQSDDLR